MVQALHREGHPIPRIASALQLNRTYCYALLKPLRTQKRQRPDEAEIKAEIRQLCTEHPTNGYRRIRVWMKKKYQRVINHKRVYRIMKELNLLVATKAYAARRKKEKGKIPVERSNQHFQTDMTKVWCGKDGWGYLFAVIDAYDREIVGYSFSRFCRTDELLQAVNMAIDYRFPTGVKGQGLRIRSDNGCQMTSKRYVQALKDAGIKQERTGYNNPDADAYIERWFRTLKEETVWVQEYLSFSEAKQDIEEYIRFYNEERPHSALRYQSPTEFRKSQMAHAA
ncbi:IS3 family transposase [Brevibacillus humidisoli]|uniref:IS3 family transposase n=1 Tax=Brevibacillus humidisoli TaxID=2895522 RepID=UPI001E530AFE|nr:IS3 family transposase [Brevibacillus humidisoli]UFJ40085.1 IS3 family transposase [Brevibacillus humidisoli]